MCLLILCVSLLFSIEESILYLTGTNDIADVGQEQMEQLRSLERHPLEINRASEKSLLESGLFSSYQVASIKDYRQRCGDILSATELGCVDSFTPEFAGYVSVFLDFGTSRSGTEVAGAGRPSPLVAESSAGFSAKASQGEGSLRAMGKLKVEYGGFRASVAARSEWTLPLVLPKTPGWSLGYSSKSFSVILGSYHARFGQGLLQWSGMVFNSYTTAQSLMRKPSGVTQYFSYAFSEALRGIAAHADIGRLGISAFADIGGRGAGANLSWNHRHGQFGLNCRYSERTLLLSADFQQTLSCVVLFGEFGSVPADLPDRRGVALAGLFGARLSTGGLDAGLRIAYRPDEHSVALSSSYLTDSRIHSFNLSGIATYRSGSVQLKTQVQYSAVPDSTLSFSLKAALSLKSASAKAEVRQDCRWNVTPKWNVSFRAHVLHCVDWALVGMAQAAFVTGRLGLFLQTGVFRIDNWDDRIYVYRRDVPGNFNVPAMYGRGWWISQFTDLDLGARAGKTRPWGRICLRVDYTAYPWARATDARRRPSAGAALQFSVNLNYLRKTKNTAATRQAKAAM